MAFRRTGFLAAFVVAATLPVAGPASAEPDVIQIPAATAAAVSQAPDPQLPTDPLTAPTVIAPLVDTRRFESIGGGMASFYGREMAGARTASGQRFDPNGLTAAHRTLPFGTHVQVTNPRTGDSVIVIINDRGPFHSNRVIDLSEAAARQIGIARSGSGVVQLAVLSPDN